MHVDIVRGGVDGVEDRNCCGGCDYVEHSVDMIGLEQRDLSVGMLLNSFCVKFG